MKKKWGRAGKEKRRKEKEKEKVKIKGNGKKGKINHRYGWMDIIHLPKTKKIKKIKNKSKMKRMNAISAWNASEPFLTRWMGSTT